MPAKPRINFKIKNSSTLNYAKHPKYEAVTPKGNPQT